jgi:hypothetical protein
MKFTWILLFFLVVGIFLSIVPNIFGSFEVEHNVTILNASGYGDTTDEYEALTSLVQTDLAIIIGVGGMLVIGMLFIMAKIFMG